MAIAHHLPKMKEPVTAKSTDGLKSKRTVFAPIISFSLSKTESETTETLVLEEAH